MLEQSGIAPDRLLYRTGQGLTVWDEPRGRRAGLPYPQISIHRGRLQRLLYDASAPTPWMKRHISSIGSDRAAVQARLAMTNSASPNTTTGLRPTRSETGP